jgi:general secretion pathway protein D
MRWGLVFTVWLGVGLVALASDQPPSVPVLPCPAGSPASPGCTPNHKELKRAKAAFAMGLRLQHEKRSEEAFLEFQTAARLVPQNVEYVTAREIARQQLVFDDIQRGTAELAVGHQIEAQADFRSALHLDSGNQFAQQRLRDALGQWETGTAAPAQIVEDVGEIRAQPNPVRADFHYRGDSRGLLAQVALAFGISAQLDDSVVSRPVRFDIQQVDFFAAMSAACAITHTFWTPLEAKQILVALDTLENHRQYELLAMRTFYIPSATTPQEVNEIMNLLRNVFDIRFVTPQASASRISVRAPQRTLDAATQFLEALGDARPQAMLDVRVYEISQTVTRNIGIHIPNHFQLFNIPAAALAALGGQNIQDLINQLIASGGINQANSQALSALLAQLQGQQNSIFSTPLATFGNGLTLMGLSLDNASAQLSLNENTVKTLEHANIRVAQGNDATFRVGTRYPILNASFAPIFNTPAISQVVQNNSFQAPFPSFNYEDIGLTVKAKPVVNGNLDVALQLEIQFRSLQGQSFNGVPVISNREYKGSIVLKDSEPAVVAGSVSRSEQRSMNGIPGLGAVPGLNQVMVSNSKEVDEDELLVVITPRVISQGNQSASTEIWMAR